VTGGLGDYLAVADTVILMEAFQPVAATARARIIVAGAAERLSHDPPLLSPTPRYPLPRGFAGLRGRQRVEMRGRGTLAIGRETVDLGGLRQLIDPSQARAAGWAILYGIEKGYFDGATSVVEVIDRVFADIEQSGLGILTPEDDLSGEHAMPRRHEVAALLNRMRALQARPRRGAAEPAAEAAPLGAPSAQPSEVEPVDGPVGQSTEIGPPALPGVLPEEDGPPNSPSDEPPAQE